MVQYGSIWIGITSSLLLIGLQFGAAKFFCGFLGFLGLLVVAGALDFIRSRDWSIPLWTCVKKYVTNRFFLLLGTFYMNPRFEWATKNPRESQNRILRSVLDAGVKTKYGQDHNFNMMKDREDYKRLHPLVKYTHFEPYVERMIEGEENVLTSQSLMYYGITSGTTGKPSRIPVTTKGFRQLLLSYIPCCAYQYVFRLGLPFPGGLFLKRRLALLFSPRKLIKTTPLGVRMGPGSALLVETDEMFSFPLCAMEITDEKTARYVYLVFGLKQRNLEQIEAIFSSIAFIVFHEMEMHWKELVTDIRDGRLKSTLTLSVEERAELQKHLTPDPVRAAELEAEFRKGFDNIVERVWPNLKLILAITSGPFEHYKGMMRDKYVKNLPIFHHLYGCTEGLLGIALWPEKEPTLHVLWPSDTFYEFIPFEHVTDEKPETVFVDQVQIGHEYEMVLTTRMGLYRYRFGDIIRVVDRYNKFPVIQILTRTGQLINMKGEKVSETALYTAINKMAAMHNKVTKIVDFTSCESMFMEYVTDTTTENAAFYVVFIEADLSLDNTNKAEMEEICAPTLDEKLCEAHQRYKYQRDKGGLDCLKVIFVPLGTFVDLRAFMLQNSTTSSAQLKLPKVLKKPELLRFMLAKAGLHISQRRGSLG